MGSLKSCLNQYSYEEAPILHAAIGKVHRDELKGIIDNFEHSAYSRDEDGNLALHVGIKKGLKWTHGMHDIVRANPFAIKEKEVYTDLPSFVFAAVPRIDNEGKQTQDIDLTTLYELSRLGLEGNSLFSFMSLSPDTT